MSEECLDSVNERSTSFITVVFTDEDGNPVTPDAATYRLDNVTRPIAAILPATAFPSLATSVDIEITSDQNQIFRNRNKEEVREVTVEFDYDGSTKHGTAKYRYKVVNLFGVVTVPSVSVSPSSSASPSA